MKLRIFTALAALTCTLNAFATTVILDGIETDGASPVVISWPVASGPLSSINFNFSFEAFSPSWGSELGIQIVAPDTTTWTLGTDGNACSTCDYNFGFTDTSGSFASNGSIDLGGSSYGAGDWQITLFESFDDAGIDGQFEEGFIEIAAMTASEPGILLLMGMGVIALGFSRRRR